LDYIRTILSAVDSEAGFQVGSLDQPSKNGSETKLEMGDPERRSNPSSLIVLCYSEDSPKPHFCFFLGRSDTQDSSVSICEAKSTHLLALIMEGLKKVESVVVMLQGLLLIG